jgi:hypothetical protein
MSKQDKTELCTPAERAFLDAMKKTMYVDIPELCPICDYDGLEPKTEVLRTTLDRLRQEMKSGNS